MKRTTLHLANVIAAAGVLAAWTACGDGEPARLAFSEAVLATDGASNPTVALDSASGTVYVAWVGTDDGVSNVHLARSTPGAGGYSTPVRVNDIPGDAAPHRQAPAQVAVGPGGRVYVVWQNNTAVEGRAYPASDLRFARSTDGGRSFEPAVTVNDDAGGPPSSHTFQDMAVAADGTVLVSWIDSRRRDSIRVARAEGGRDGGGDAGDATEPEPPGPEIRVARSVDGGRTFSPGVVVDDDSCPCCRTSLALGPDGAVYVAWRKVYPGDIRDIVVARSTDGGRSFAAPVRVHDDGWVFPGCPHAGPSVAVDGAGRVHVGWYTGRDAGPGLYHAVSNDAARTFGEPAPLLAADWVPPSQVKLAADGGGTVWIAWDDRRDGASRVRMARAVGPAPPEDIAGASMQGAAPAVAAAGASWAVAWLDGETVRVRMSDAAPSGAADAEPDAAALHP